MNDNENKAVELTDEQLEQVNGGTLTISSLSDLDGLKAGEIGPDFILNGVVYRDTHKILHGPPFTQSVNIFENADGVQVYIPH